MATVTPTEYSTIKTVKTERNKLAHDAREIVKKAEIEKRDMSAEENEKFSQMADKVMELDDRVEKLEAVMNEDEEPDGDEEEDDTSSTDDSEERSIRLPDGRRGVIIKSPEKRSLLNSKRGERRNIMPRLPGESEESFKTRQRRSQKKYWDACSAHLCDGVPLSLAGGYGLEKRDLLAGTDSKGGYLILPQQLSEYILKKVNDVNQVRANCTVIKMTQGGGYGVPAIDTEPDYGSWTTEIANIPEDSSMAFGKRSLTPFPIRKREKVSERFLRITMDHSYFTNSNEGGKNNGGSPENIVVDRLSVRLGNGMESGFNTGTGSAQALGLFTASSRGLSTAVDVLTGSSTGITYAGLVNAQQSLKVQYQDAAKWLVSRTFLKKLLGLVDLNGRPLLDMQTLPGAQTQLMGNGLVKSEFCPNTFTSGNYVAIFGDLKYYWVVDQLEIAVARANELYLETMQIGFFVYAETDGMPVLEEAFARLKCD